MGAVNGWRDPPLGYSVDRIDYKLYRVWISGTD